MVGVNGQTVVNWERYRTVPLRRDARLEAACEMLGVDLWEMKKYFPWNGRLSRSRE